MSARATVFHCANCGGPLAATASVTTCAYCRCENAIAVPVPAREKPRLDGRVQVMLFAPTPLLHDVPAWLHAPTLGGDPALVVMPTVGPRSTDPATAGVVAGLAHYLADRLVIDADVNACSGVLVDVVTMTQCAIRSAPSLEDWRGAVADLPTPPALMWVEADDDGDLTLRMVSAAGQRRDARGDAATLAAAAVRWAVDQGLGKVARGRSSWHRPPSPDATSDYLLALGLQAQLVVASYPEGQTALATAAFRSMADGYDAEDVGRLVDAAVSLIERHGAALPQLALVGRLAMTTADERDALEDARRARLARLAVAAAPGTALHAMSPWLLDFVGASERARCRMCSLRPRAMGAFAAWLDAIEFDEPVAAEALHVLAALPVVEGPHAIRPGVGLGRLEFGATLAELEAALGPATPAANNPAEVTFLGGQVGVLLDEDGAYMFDVSSDRFALLDDDVWRQGPEALRADLEARGAEVRQVGRDQATLLEVPALALAFTFRAGRLENVEWSAL